MHTYLYKYVCMYICHVKISLKHFSRSKTFSVIFHGDFCMSRQVHYKTHTYILQRVMNTLTNNGMKWLVYPWYGLDPNLQFQFPYIMYGEIARQLIN